MFTEQHSTRPVYGCPLDEHLQSSGREIALVIEACVGILYHDGLEEEGLFRIAGSAAKLKKLKVWILGPYKSTKEICNGEYQANTNSCYVERFVS